MYRNTTDGEYVLDGERAIAGGDGWEHLPDTVWLDGLEEMGAVPAALLDDRRWNGWVCPWFTRENAERIATASNEIADGPDSIRFHWDGDTLYETSDYGYGDESHAVETREHDGATLYGVGNCSWVWMVGAPGDDAKLSD